MLHIEVDQKHIVLGVGGIYAFLSAVFGVFSS